MIHGDSLEYMSMMPSCSVDFILADPPYGDIELINTAIKQAYRICKGASLFFMYPEDLCYLDIAPQQVIHWVKTPSTKNTSRKYSRFVEAIACYNLHLSPFNQDTHWTTRSGVFTDSFSTKQVHPFEKPASLLEKLLVVHTKPGDLVLDPFAGSGSVEKVCERIGRKCLSIEIS